MNEARSFTEDGAFCFIHKVIFNMIHIRGDFMTPPRKSGLTSLMRSSYRILDMNVSQDKDGAEWKYI